MPHNSNATKVLKVAQLSNRAPNQDYSQRAIRLLLTRYLESKAKKIPASDVKAREYCVLDEQLSEGMCNAITTWWMYHKCLDREQEYFDQIDRLLCWDQAAFDKDPNKKEEPFIEEYFHTIAFLQFGHEIVHTTDFFKTDQLLDVVLSDCMPKLRAAEFSFTFAFNASSLHYFLLSVVPANKMIRLDNGFHCIGLVYSGKKYYVFDPSYKHGAIPITQSLIAAKAILESFAIENEDTTVTAMNIQFFDFVHNEPLEYVPVEDIMRAFFANQQFKAEVLKNPQIFHLAAKNNDLFLIQFLFDQGYKYIPWTLTKFSELDRAITENHEPLLRLLLKNGISPNLTCQEGRTPISRAIAIKRTSLLHILLLAGADPNLPIHHMKSTESKKQITPLLYAAKKHQATSVRMLLEFGAKVDDHAVAAMRKGLSADEYKYIMQGIAKSRTLKV